MTAVWSLPVRISPSSVLMSPVFDPGRVRVIIPTYRDWEDARLSIEALLNCRPAPREIVLVSDNDERGFPGWASRYPVRCVDSSGNRGPASARNAGARLTRTAPIDWLYFTDTGCAREAD